MEQQKTKCIYIKKSFKSTKSINTNYLKKLEALQASGSELALGALQMVLLFIIIIIRPTRRCHTTNTITYVSKVPTCQVTKITATNLQKLVC